MKSEGVECRADHERVQVGCANGGRHSRSGAARGRNRGRDKEGRGVAARLVSPVDPQPPETTDTPTLTRPEEGEGEAARRA